MHALGLRLASALEWGIAAAFLAATLAVASLILQDMRARGPAIRASAAPREAPVAVPEIPAAVPAGAVSVPILPFGDGKEIRVGDTAAAVAARLGRAAENGREEVDRARLGQRLTRFYEYAGFRFIVVYEPFERNGEPRASAIYLP
jgi:hypothetical protein